MATAPTVSQSALFSRDAAVGRLLLRIKQMPGMFKGAPDPELLWEALLSAEGEAVRKLGVFLRPTQVFPVRATAEQIAALPAGRPYVTEPAYDLPPDWLQVGTFGALKLNHKLVNEVQALELRHPAYQQEAYRIPIEWVHLEPDAGMINVVAGGPGFNTLPLGAFTLQALSSGYSVPHMIRVTYVAGLTLASPFHNDIVSLVYRQAALRLLHDQFIPQSTSISADGLSQSRSQDLGKHQDALDAAFASLRERLHGPVWGVL